jgi:hypothetical protein
MGGILEFFGEEVAGVDDARNVSDFCCAILVEFAHIIFTEAEMFGAFVGA